MIKIALCNRSRKDAVVTIDTCHKSATSSAFRLRHREVPRAHLLYSRSPACV